MIFKAEQIHAILKAVCRDGFSMQSIADLYCVSLREISDLFLKEGDNQRQAKWLAEKPVSQWRVRKRQRESVWALESMSVGQIKEFHLESMEDVPVFKRRYRNRVWSARRYGMDFSRKIKGREVIIERIA